MLDSPKVGQKSSVDRSLYGRSYGDSPQKLACSRLPDGGKGENSRGRRGDWGGSAAQSLPVRFFSRLYFASFPLQSTLSQAETLGN